MHTFSITGNYVDLFNREVFPANIRVVNGIITEIERISEEQEYFLLPGFVDAHVHIESSMLVPSSFAHLAAIHGTVATVSDPHEIANVCGMEGIRFMIDNAAATPFRFFFGAPSCVPATSFETAGAVIDAAGISVLMRDPDIWYLAEMMNYPGVLFDDPEVMAKLEAAKKSGKPIDGHAPGLRGRDVVKYASSGITTDHESTTLEEALEKIEAGMHCLIREGSAARNFDALIEVLRLHPDKVMFCTDDKHPDELIMHHINDHVKRAVALGYDLYDVLRAASVNPVLHYNIPVGLLRAGDAADFIVVADLKDFQVLKTYIAGELVANYGVSLLPVPEVKPVNRFHAVPIRGRDLIVHAISDEVELRVIEALDGQLITKELIMPALVRGGRVIADIGRDILKLVMVNRYQPGVPPAVAFVRNYGLKAGAIASTVAHDCHNIIAVGVDDESIAAAINAIIEVKGGISVAASAAHLACLPLPVAGLMTDEDGLFIAKKYAALDEAAKQLGTQLRAPFMTLSFMGLLVIPSLKLSDKGLFDGSKFAFTDLQITASSSAN